MNGKSFSVYWVASFLLLFIPNAKAQPPLSSLVLNGSGRDVITSIVSLPDGAAFVGVTTSGDLPVTMGDAYAGDDDPEGPGDVFVGRTSKSGQLLWLRYLGGGGSDFGNGIAWDGDQTLTLSGWTTSDDLPLVDPIQSALGGKSDTLLAQFDLDGTLLFSSYYGGGEDDQWAAVAWHPQGQAWIFGGFTNTPHSSAAPGFPFPENNPSNTDQTKSSNQDTDGLFMVLNPDRSIRLASYHGRTTGRNEIVYAVAAGNFEEFIIAGVTDDGNFYNNGGTRNAGGKDLFVNRIDLNEGVRRWSKSLGYAGDETAFAVSYHNDRVAVAGVTTSADIGFSTFTPSSAVQAGYGGGESDGFIWVFDSSDTFNNGRPTFLGGTGSDSVRSIAFAEDGDLLFAGTTDSDNLPFPANPVYPPTQSTMGGETDGFFGRLGFTGFSNFDYLPEALSYLGESNEDGLLALAVDVSGSPADNPIGYLPVVGGASRLIEGDVRRASLANSNFTRDEAAFLQFFGINDANYDVRVDSITVSDEFIDGIPYGSKVPVKVTFINDGPETVFGNLHIEIYITTRQSPTNVQEEIITGLVQPLNVDSSQGFVGGTLFPIPALIIDIEASRNDPEQYHFSAGKRISFTFDALAETTLASDLFAQLKVSAMIRVHPSLPLGPEVITHNNFQESFFDILHPKDSGSATGKVYVDANSNGKPDQDEGIPSGVKVGVWKPGGVVETVEPNYLGELILFLEDELEHTIGLLEKPDNLALWPGSPETYTIVPKKGENTPHIDFPLFDVTQSADIKLSVIESNPDVGEGERAGITLVVTNNGPMIATGLDGTIELDGASINYSFEALGVLPPLAAGGGFAGQFPFFKVPSLLPGQTALFDFDITAFSAEAFTFKARVIGEQPDPNPFDNESVFNLSFGAPESVIEGRVYVDANLNGRYDPGEAPLSGVEVTATSADGETSSSTTDDLGLYGFTPHEAEVEVSVVPKENQFVTEPAGGSKTVSVQPGKRETVDFGFIEEEEGRGVGSAVGSVWDDANGDGLRQAAEPGIVGAVVFLDLNNNGVQDPVSEPLTVTNGDGMFFFRNLQPGSYHFRQIIDAIQYQTFPTVRTSDTPPDARFPGYRVTVEADRISSGLDFGNYRFQPSALEFSAELEHLVFDESGQVLWKPLPVDLERLKPYTYGGNKVRIRIRVGNRTPLDFTLDLTATDELGELIPLQSSVGRVFSVPRETEREAFVEFNPKEPWVNGEARPGMGVHLPPGKLGGDRGIPADDFDRDLLIRPQPVVGLPGIWRDAQSFELFSSRLPAFRPDLQFYVIDDGTFPTTYNQGALDGPLTNGSNIVADAQKLADYLNTLRSGLEAYQVDLVAHSTAGLAARYYIQELMPPSGNEAPVIRKLITLGTPHEGLPVSAPPAWALERYRFQAPNTNLPFPANLFELEPRYINNVFNRLIELNRGVEFYAVAGTQLNALGAFPGTPGDGDGWVSLQSALGLNTPSLFFKDIAVVNESHRSLPENQEVLNLVIRALVDAPLGNNPIVDPSPGPGVFELDTVLLETVTVGSGQTRELSLEVGTADTLWVAVSDHSHIESVVTGPGLPLPALPPAFLNGLWPAYFKVHQVQGPNSGTWTIRLSHDGTSPDPAQLMVLGFEKNSGIRLVSNAETLDPSDGILVSGRLIPVGANAVTGATAYWASLSGATTSTSLLDDGQGLDGTALDGVFTGMVTTVHPRIHSGMLEFASAGLTRYGFSTSNPLAQIGIEVARLTVSGVESSWPALLGSDVVVETLSDLNSGDWSALSTSPALRGDRYYLNIPIPQNGSGFFRLRYPIETLLGKGAQ